MGWDTAKKDPAYGRADWKRARTACLTQARWRCQIRMEGCQGAASEADHIDGLAADPQHKRLRATCVSCHRKVTSEQGHDARQYTARDPAVQQRTQWNIATP